jgi:ribonuclease E
MRGYISILCIPRWIWPDCGPFTVVPVEVFSLILKKVIPESGRDLQLTQQ